MHYYSFNIGDYAGHTSRLSPMEDLSYRRLLDLYYLSEQPISGSIDDIAREVGLIEFVDSVEYVLGKFFTQEENVFRQKRIDIEIKKYRSNAKNKSKAGKASAKARQAKASSDVTGVEQVLNTSSTDEQLNINHKPLTINQETLKDKDKSIEQNALLEEGFEIFYTAGLVKKSKLSALKTFKSLCKAGKFEPSEFGGMLANDVRQRISSGQFGIDKLHPSTYLNQHRWTDEKTNDGIAQATGKQSAAERITARNNAKYGQPSSGLGLAEGRRDLRGAMDQGERGITFDDVGSCIEQDDTSRGENWD
jgi:uncharacterized protein YdaU (DUF1376 family)